MTLRPSILLILLISSTCAAAYAPASKAQISDAETSGLQTVGPLPLTYRDAQARLLQRSDAIEASDADVRSREAQENAVRTLRLPTVEFEGQMMRYQKTLYLPLGPLADVAQDYAISDPLQFQMERDSTRPIITATVPLYSGGRIPAAQAAAEAQLGQSRAERQIVVDNALLQMTELYFGQQLLTRVRDRPPRRPGGPRTPPGRCDDSGARRVHQSRPAPAGGGGA